ncbi:MAG: cytochrome P460 [Planctomycetota bacterium]|nr:MAG: cytochrome P460 [Planctomycetota bacterium]REJ87293.1 MAG: cytochrome P460 [Planctomycetota bacterium]REK27884.1 MAG: cytochrome P460 [Planctomycetota bacterium]REK32805.1 MAG: cytochrome P460 [Planctomycetota bacterium]
MTNTEKLSLLGTATLLFGAVLTPLFLSGCGASAFPTTNATASAAEERPQTRTKPGATYNDKGELIRPADHREWVFVGAPVTPNDMNDGKAAFPEFHNVYIDPASYAAYKQTGKFADGTVILKELVSVGGKQMDSGNGYFQGEFVSLEAMVKDSSRFSDEPGSWAFFRFGEAPNYTATGTRMKTESCNSCHSGANEDYVFTSTYPVLRAARPKMTGE